MPVTRRNSLSASHARRAVRRHPIAGPLLFGSGLSEVSLFWTDEETEVRMRTRLDRYTTLRSGRDAVVELKTVADGGADPAQFSRTVANFKYHTQAAIQLAGGVATGFLEPDAAHIFVLVEKAPPHLVTVAELDQDALAVGADLWRRAMQTFRDCSLSGEWPSYTSDIASVSLPRWAA